MNDIYTVSMVISIAVFILTTHITPGPTNIILLSSILNFGYKRSIPFMIGNVISYPLMILLTCLGLGIFLVEHPELMNILKIVGIVYLCYLAYKIASDNSSYESDASSADEPFTFFQALTYPFSNLKAWVLYTSVIPMFITSEDNSSMQIAVIVIFTLFAMIITVYAWAAGGLIIRRFINNKKLIKRVNIFMALLLVASILPIITL